MQVVVNADDLGISNKVNDSVFEMMEERLVSSATIMANGPQVEDACRRLTRFPQCSFGVHLNITQFAPLTSSGEFEALTDGCGEFLTDTVRRIKIDSALAQAIYDEFCAQIQRLVYLGVPVSHLDSHHHVHTIPGVFSVLKRVQKQFDIRKVRITRNIYAQHEHASRSLLVKKAFYNFALRHYIGTKTTQGFTDYKTFCQASESALKKYRSVEIMMHPGSSVYEDESDELRGPWRESRSFPIDLISYNELG
jgi:predicted glycoside hydrolase/deacetylase ChbG (UPF0249 family)